MSPSLASRCRHLRASECGAGRNPVFVHGFGEQPIRAFAQYQIHHDLAAGPALGDGGGEGVIVVAEDARARRQTGELVRKHRLALHAIDLRAVELAVAVVERDAVAAAQRRGHVQRKGIATDRLHPTERLAHVLG